MKAQPSLLEPVWTPTPVLACQCAEMGTHAPCGWCDGPDREIIERDECGVLDSRPDKRKARS